jgi:hypothetical protein
LRGHFLPSQFLIPPMKDDTKREFIEPLDRP